MRLPAYRALINYGRKRIVEGTFYRPCSGADPGFDSRCPRVWSQARRIVGSRLIALPNRLAISGDPDDSAIGPHATSKANRVGAIYMLTAMAPPNKHFVDAKAFRSHSDESAAICFLSAIFICRIIHVLSPLTVSYRTDTGFPKKGLSASCPPALVFSYS
jgi:hypothetical protein